MFKTARFKLTLWYGASVALILMSFSLILYFNMAQSLKEDVEVERETEVEGSAAGNSQDRHLEELFVSASLAKLREILVASNLGVLLLSMGASYWLAGRTLRPIDEVLKRERRFTAGASHELRTPLTVIQSGADMMLQRKRSPEEYEETLRDIREEAVYMSQVVADLLTLARDGTASRQVFKEPVHLRVLLEEIIRRMEPVAAARGLRLESRLEIDSVVQGDQQRLRQMFFNLVENAIKYNKDDGEVFVGLQREAHWAKVEVKDTGMGMTAEDLRHVFEPFYRVDKARSRQLGGSGLGLAICDWVIRAHNGHIDVVSQIDQGTTFTVWLPAV